MMLWMDSPFKWPLMTVVEVMGDIGMATLVPDLDLIQGINSSLVEFIINKFIIMFSWTFKVSWIFLWCWKPVKTV